MALVKRILKTYEDEHEKYNYDNENISEQYVGSLIKIKELNGLRTIGQVE